MTDRSSEFSVGASTKLFIKIGRDGLTDEIVLEMEMMRIIGNCQFMAGHISSLRRIHNWRELLTIPIPIPIHLQGAYVVFIQSSSILNRGSTS